ncbi:BTAD domain-containing putative transcriptional regulator [Tengunoibacter tsumagoiensis]|uniref:Transcriptional activator n=1 Tax=Tengunoibacter tsumagoiensis TaxID=2014871 RepID=A0A402A5U3_9CHLR|nr:BTAD domain-containing putative transcriptional regulator [Tengunoibacter tsumagoiensis]GCE14514.1 transcriptional activator [Tengunoibacter tsumagoiensis]
MSISHSTRKVSQPALPPQFLSRPRLLQLLMTTIHSSSPTENYKLFLICAPAGYGKTTLLVDYAQQTAIPCCWMLFDQSDADLVTFIECLFLSLRQRFPHFGRDLNMQFISSLIPDAAHPIREQVLDQFVDAFAAALENDILEPFVLFLCNYHEINDSKFITYCMNRLLKYLPSHCTIVIESRAVPALDLVPLLALHQLYGLGINDLRFSAQEIREFSRLQPNELLSDQELEDLTGSFDGWIAGILLGTRVGNMRFLSSSSAHLRPQPWSMPGLQMNQQTLFAYLVNEVFHKEPELYQFLKTASFLQQMNASFCNELFDMVDAGARLTMLERQGLFITKIDDGAMATYICHPILRELLYEEACREDQATVASLHRQASQLYYRWHNYAAAIEHALAAHEDMEAAQIIGEVAQRMVSQGHLDTLAGWIDRLKEEVFAQSPQLLLARANIYLTMYEPIKALPLLTKAYNLVNQGEVIKEAAPTLQSEILIAHSTAVFYAGDYAQSQQFCHQALALLSVDVRELRALIYHRLGVCASVMGDCNTGIMQMQQALQLWGPHTEGRQIANLHGNLANTYMMVGNYILSEHHRARAIALHERSGNVWGKVNNLIWMAMLKRNKGSFLEAEQMLEEILALARSSHFKSGEAYALLNLGETYLDQDLLEKALVVTEDGLALARQLEDSYLTNHILSVLAMIYSLLGDTATALLLVNQIAMKSELQQGYEYSLREVTRGTLLLLNRQYSEALHCFSQVEVSLNTAALKRLYLRALLRLAVCHMHLDHPVEAALYLEKAQAQDLAGNHEPLVTIEVRRFPLLRQLISQHPQRSHFASWLADPPVAVEVYAEAGVVPSHKDVSLSSIPSLPSSAEAAIPEVETAEEWKVRIFGFGEPSVTIHGAPVNRWRMARSMELYFFLLDHNRPVHKERIIAALWPDENDHDQTLRSTVYYLRKAIGETCIPYQGGAYSLDLAALYGDKIWYDVQIFSEFYARAKAALADEKTESAKKLLQETIDLYRGDYAQSFYSDWCSLRRDELRTTYLDARRELALLFWRDKQLEECIVQWQYLLAMDNCREDAHYGLMRAYMSQGKRGLALRQYQRCVDLLQEELGVPPSASIQKLYQRLLGNV